MKLVIDIPEILFEKIQNRKADKRTLETVIMCGTLLPEEHGRLKDIEVLDDSFFKATDYPNAKLSYEEISDILLDAPTIIEADKEYTSCQR